MRPPSKSLSRRDVGLLSLLLLIGLPILAVWIGTNIGLAGYLGGGGETFLPWKAGRTFLFDHIDPYSGDVAAQVQLLVYGHTFQPGSNPYILIIPFHLLLCFLPFSLIPDPYLTRGIFAFISEVGLIALAIYSLRLADWEPRRPFLAAYLIAVVLSFYSYQSVVEGSPSILLGLAFAGILLSLRDEMDEVAGALLFVCCFRWELGGPFLLLIFLRVIFERRWSVLYGFAMLAFILLTVSFFVYPDWVIPFLRATYTDISIHYGFQTGTIFARFWPSFGSTLAEGLTVLLVVILVFEWSMALRSNFRHFYWAACLTLAITPLLGQRSMLTNLVVLLPSSAFIISLTVERWRAGYRIAGLLSLFVFGVPWFFFARIALFFDPNGNDILFLFLPVFTVIGLYWVRWWAVHPPLTWLDRATRLDAAG